MRCRCSNPTSSRVLQEGIAVPTGNAALIAAGTGLGEALLHNVNGRFLPSASEGGHADFAARTPRELALVGELARIHGRVDNERVISGPGLVNLFRFTHGTQDLRSACRVLGPDVDPSDLPAAISECALEKRCRAMCRGARHVRRGLRRRSRQPGAAIGRDGGRLRRRRHRAEDPARAREWPASWPRSSTRSRWWISCERCRSGSSSIRAPGCWVRRCGRRSACYTI